MLVYNPALLAAATHIEPEEYVFALFNAVKKAFDSHADLALTINNAVTKYHFRVSDGTAYFQIILARLVGANGATTDYELSQPHTSALGFIFKFSVLNNERKIARLQEWTRLLEDPDPSLVEAIVDLKKITDAVTFTSTEVGKGLNFVRGGKSLNLKIEPVLFIKEDKVTIGLDVQGTPLLMHAMMLHIGDHGQKKTEMGFSTINNDALKKVAEIVAGPKALFLEKIKAASSIVVYQRG